MTLRIVLVTLVWVATPGFLTSVVSRRRGAGWAEAAGTGVVGGTSVLVFGAVAIEKTFGFHSQWVLGATLWLGLLEVAALVLLAPTIREIPRPGRRTIAVAGLVLMATVPVATNVLHQGEELGSATSWYYWRQVEETITAGEFPETTREWGVDEVPFQLDYPGFTASAVLIDVVANGYEERPPRPADRVGAARAMSLLALAGFLIGSAVLARLLGADAIGTACGVVLMSSTAVLGLKLVGLRTETFAYGLLLCLPALHLAWMRRRDRCTVGVLAVGVGALALMHGVVLLLTGILLVAAGVGSFIRGSGNRRWVVGNLVAAAACALVYLATIAVFLGGSTDAAGLEGLPEIAADGTDPSFEFFRLVTGLSEDETPPSTREITDDALQNVFLGRPPSWQIGFTTAALLAGLLGSIRRPRDGLRVLAFGVVTSVLVWLVVQYFGTYDTYVPRRTGALRVTQLALGLIPVFAVAAVGTVPRRFRRNAAVALVVVTVLVGASAWPELARTDVRSNGGDLAFVLDRLALAEDDVILTNAFTEGRLEFLTPAEVLLSGRSPYLQADLLERANTLLARAQDFFLGGDDSLLDDYGVTVILAARDGSFGTSFRFTTDYRGLQTRENLRLVAEDRSLVAYRVVRDDRLVDR